MNTIPKKRLPGQALAALIILTLGIALLVYSVIVEDEPGGVPLLLIFGSITWLVIQRVRRLRRPARP